MAAMGAALSDADLAAVLTYIRSFVGQQGGTVTPDDVKAVRADCRRPSADQRRAGIENDSGIIHFRRDSISEIAQRACSAINGSESVRGFFKCGQGGCIADISQRDADISQKPAPFRPQNRRSGKTRFEILLRRAKAVQSNPAVPNLFARATSSDFLRAQICSTGKQPGNRRSRKCDCRWRGEIQLELGLSVQSSDRKCSCARPVETAR